MKDVTYGHYVCTVRPEKAKPNHMRFTVGGDRNIYPVHPTGVRQNLIPWQSRVDSTLLCLINAIASQSSKPTEDTMWQTLQLLNYLATKEDAVLSYHASDMVLAVHSNVSYLSKPKARSRAGEHFFLSSDTTIPPNNGTVLNIAYIIKNVMSSATKTELVGLYIMVRESVYIRIILEELGHKQPPTPLQTGNELADAVISGKVQPR